MDHSKLEPYQIPQPDLRHVVADVLVVLQIRIRVVRLISRLLTRIRNHDALQLLGDDIASVDPSLRRRASDAVRGERARFLRGFFGAGVAGQELIHRVPELGFAEKEQACVTRAGADAVVGGFGRDVGEVDALAKGVTVDRCLWGCDAEALAQDAAYKVC